MIINALSTVLERDKSKHAYLEYCGSPHTSHRKYRRASAAPGTRDPFLTKSKLCRGTLTDKACADFLEVVTPLPVLRQAGSQGARTAGYGEPMRSKFYSG